MPYPWPPSHPDLQVEKAATYGEVRRRRNLDPRKRKIGNAGIKDAKKPSLDTCRAAISHEDDEEEEEEDYHFGEQEDQLDARQEERELELLEYEEAPEDDYQDYQDGDGLF